MSEVKRSSHDLKINVETGLKSSRILINDPDPVIKFGLPDGEPRPSVRINGNGIEISHREYKRSIEVRQSGDKLTISTGLRPWEHILGLGEKTLPLDRRRVRVAMWNYDNFGYQRGVDPLYISIPFIIIISRGFSFGIFVNHPGYSVFDIGYSEYDKILIEVWDISTEVFAIVGSSPKEVLEIYTTITGKPFIPPRWALGHQLSRYSYYPQGLVLEIIDKILEYAPLDVIYLDH